MGFWARLFGREKKKSDDRFLSIVFLLGKPVDLTAPMYAKLLATFIQGVEKRPEPPGTSLKQMDETCNGLMIEDQPFVVISVSAPYSKANASDISPDKRIQRILKTHTAWLACDWMPPVGSEKDRDLAYRVMGMVMGLLSRTPMEILGAYDKGTGRLVQWNEQVRDRLTGDDPEKAFELDVPVWSAEGLEEELERATKEAVARLPEFVSGWQDRTTGEKFSVKARFEEEGDAEWMWIDIDNIEGDIFEGRLGNNPNRLKSLKLGDPVRVRSDEVADWVIARKGGEGGKWGLRGGFSVEVFRKRQGG